MNKRILLFALIFNFTFSIFNSFSQDSLNMTKLGHLSYTAQLSNIWGYAADGNEYALVGTDNGMSIVDITNPATPAEVYFKPGPGSIWREIKTFGDYAYVVTEGGGGLQIIDMSPLPQNTNLSSVNFFGTNPHSFTSAHTLYIDENGILYIFGSDYSEGGALIFDLNTDPTSPVYLGVWDDYYIHDGMVRGDTLWASSIYDGFLGIINVTDKANPVEEESFSTTSNFTHNSWPNDNNNFLFTTDEVSNSYVASYDVSNYNNIALLDTFQHHPGSNSIAHNTHYLNGHLYTSYYTDGVVVIDASHPNNLVESGYYDTAPDFEGDGFNGCWGVYPYLPSGSIIASDMNTGLWILGFNNTLACYLEGTVTDITNGNALIGASIEILTTGTNANTDIEGEYATGFANANTYSVVFSKGGYISDTITNVVLTSGNITVLDVALTPDIPFNFTGQVVEAGTGTPIPNAFVNMYSNNFNFNLTADGNGFFNVSAFFAGNYEITAGKWGYITWCGNALTITSTSGTIIVELEKGIYDDFSFNFGWTETNTSQTGQWERGVPVGTDFDGEDSNPGEDVTNDCLGLAFVTGNDGGSAGDDDVDDGNVVLTSPVFDLINYNEPYIHYSRWFFNGGGNGDSPNDSLIIELNNGQQTVVLERISSNTAGMSSWVDKVFRISDYLTPTATMTLKATATDYAQGHLVEAGLDKFYIEEFNNISVPETNKVSVKIYPNPANSTVTLSVVEGQPLNFISIMDITGREISKLKTQNSKLTFDISNLSPGIYFIRLQDTNGKNTHVEKLIKN